MEDVYAIAEEIGLAPAPRGSDDLLHVTDADVAFILREHHDVYEVDAATRWHDRSMLAAFESVEDARRFLVMEFGAVARARGGLAELVADSLPPGFVIEEAPTALLLSWFTGSAEFPAGSRGLDRAYAFSRVERAGVEQIHATYLDSGGHPLFDAA
jgi:hypothetical protein